mgnify:CR=1 FL=1
MATFGQHAQWPRNCPEVLVRDRQKNTEVFGGKLPHKLWRKEFRVFDMFGILLSLIWPGGMAPGAVSKLTSGTRYFLGESQTTTPAPGLKGFEQN